MKIDKDELKEKLTIEQVKDIVDSLGGEAIRKDNSTLICKTICHKGSSHKLYYYNNSHLFKCYTDCDGVWDIYELVRKVKGEDWTLSRAIGFVASYFGYSKTTFDFEELMNDEQKKEWEILRRYERINMVQEPQKVELKIYDSAILDHLPHPRIAIWEKEGMTSAVLDNYNICYDPGMNGIVIPHYNMEDKLVGIRERILAKEEEEQFGKYRPAVINGTMYNHPLSFNLYNINKSKNNLRRMKKAIVFEGEKSCLLYSSYFGQENDISVACCGSSLITYQVKLLLTLGVTEIVIAFDKQFRRIGDDEFQRWTRKLIAIHTKYSAYANINFLFDKWNMLGYKDSPIDKGKETFLTLYKNKISLS